MQNGGRQHKKDSGFVMGNEDQNKQFTTATIRSVLLQAKCNRPKQGRSIRNSERKLNSQHFNRHGTEES